MAITPVRIPSVIKFGEDYEFDVASYQLRHGSRVLKLEPTPMELLVFLLEQNGRLVSRSEIIARIWGQDVFLDTDNSINGAIRKIRAVLKDDPENPKFVQTIPGKGYRFIAPVAMDPVEPEPPQPVQQLALVPPPKSSSKKRWPLIAGICALLLLAAIGLWWKYSQGTNQADVRQMLAVLPFENLTGDANQDYFSDGLTEEMIAQLGHADPTHLGVIARTSVMHYRHSSAPLSQIAQELGVQYVLEGSVRRDASSVRITAQLIEMKHQTHLWSRQYDREPGSLLQLQAEIAQEIADKIQQTLGNTRHNKTVHASTTPSMDYAAYDLYLQGRYFWNKRTTDGFQQAVKCFEGAIARSPGYAKAYAGLADSYAMMASYGLGDMKTLTGHARAAALKALEIDPNLAEAHTSLAVIAQNYDWDWQTSEEEYRRAIQLDPNYATAHHWYAEFLCYQGRFDEAFAEINRARALDPLSLIISTDEGAIFLFAHQYDRAIEKLESVLKMEPNFPRARLVGFAYIEQGRLADADANLEKWQAAFANDDWILMFKVLTSVKKGDMTQARTALAALENRYKARDFDPVSLICAYIAIGDKDKAFEWFERGYSLHSTALTTLKVNPLYDPLRNDPRFSKLLRKVHLDN